MSKEEFRQHLAERKLMDQLMNQNYRLPQPGMTAVTTAGVFLIVNVGEPDPCGKHAPWQSSGWVFSRTESQGFKFVQTMFLYQNEEQARDAANSGHGDIASKAWFV